MKPVRERCNIRCPYCGHVPDTLSDEPRPIAASSVSDEAWDERLKHIEDNHLATIK